MKPLFVDTAGWMACADADDPDHARAAAARDRALLAGLHLLSTDYVADETLTLIRARLGLSAAIAWWRSANASPRLHWERIDAPRFDRAMAIFGRYRDKQYSFTDCTSFAVMAELGLGSALTTDRHFAQMGFTLLPGAKPKR